MLTERGWNNRGAFELNGFVKDLNGVEKLRIKGKWNGEIIAVDKLSKQETVLWNFADEPPGNPLYYGYDEYLMNINHINDEIAVHAASTDSRFRPD